MTTYDDLKFFFGNRIQYIDSSVLNEMLDTDDIIEARNTLIEYEMEVIKWQE